VHFLQIKLPACRVIYFLENEKKFSKFGPSLCDIFTISQLKTSKKPRGYRIFLKIGFDLRGVEIFASDSYSTGSKDTRRKIIKKILEI
jgi:hypothetical protein